MSPTTRIRALVLGAAALGAVGLGYVADRAATPVRNPHTVQEPQQVGPQDRGSASPAGEAVPSAIRQSADDASRARQAVVDGAHAVATVLRGPTATPTTRPAGTPYAPSRRCSDAPHP